MSKNQVESYYIKNIDNQPDIQVEGKMFNAQLAIRKDGDRYVIDHVATGHYLFRVEHLRTAKLLAGAATATGAHALTVDGPGLRAVHAKLDDYLRYIRDCDAIKAKPLEYSFYMGLLHD